MSSFSSNGLYIYLYINTHPTQNLILAWQSQIKETIFFLNQWNELQTGYIDNAGYCTFCTVNCTVTMPCPSSNIPLRKSDTWDIHNLIHALIHDTYFVNKIPIVWYHYYTCNVQIITLIAINYSFLFPFYFYFFLFLHSRWYLEVLCCNVTFLSDSQKYNGSWLAICSNCRYQYGLTNLVQLLHLSCLVRSSLIFNLQD